MCQKQLMSQVANTASIAGFGFDNNGEVDTLYRFLSAVSVFPGIASNTTAKLGLVALMLSFDTGMAPAAGYTRTVTSANVAAGRVTRQESRRR